MISEHDHPEENELPPKTGRRKPPAKGSVFIYIIILFIAAFLLLLLSYLMQQRNNEEVISGLRDSASAIQSIEDLQNEKNKLTEQVEALQEKNDLLEETIQNQQDKLLGLSDSLTQKEKEALAVDWLRQIQTLYAKKYYKSARSLISDFQATGLVPYLPEESAVSDKLSPAEDYRAILDALY